MIRSMKLKNFKAFQESGNIDIDKITILVGPNSSGKSSFIKSLLALKNSVDSKDNDTVLGFDKDIGTFKTVVYNNRVKNMIGYKIFFKNNLEPEISHRKTKAEISATLLQILNTLHNKGEKIQESLNNLASKILDIKKKYIIESIEFNIKQTNSKRVKLQDFTIRYTNNEEIYIYQKWNSYYLKMNNIDLTIPNIVKSHKFYFKLNSSKFKDLQINELEAIIKLEVALNEIERRISSFTDKIIHIEPLRNKFERVEYVTNLKLLNSVGAKGENTTTALLGILTNEEESRKIKVSSEINRWTSEFGLGETIEIKQLSNDNYSLEIKNKNTGIINNIVDVGVGTSQLLPIIIESINSSENSTLIIEEPETHIHPNAQSKLADLFVECAKKQGKKFIIETHSIFLILQLQILVAKGEISSNDINVYYFDQDNSGTVAKHMELAGNGQFYEEWPSGFFDVHYELSKLLFKSM